MLCCVSIDLDPLSCYRRIYGLEGKPAERDPVATTAVERYCELMESLDAVGTLFVVGETLEQADAVARIRYAAERGHEVANHTWSHPYDLSRMDPSRIDEQIARGARAVERVVGHRPEGFRAPGYLLGKAVMGRLERAGVRYDSSVLPSPWYPLVKAAIIGIRAMRGYASRSVLGNPFEAFGRKLPYHPDPRRPWRRGTARLVEMPITALGGLPLTGSVLALLGRRMAGVLARAAARSPFVNLELHAVDLLDIQTDGLDPALAVQPDLRMDWVEKAGIVRSFLERVARSHRLTTLGEAAGCVAVRP